MMKKIFLFSLLLTSVVFAQLPTRPVFPAGNGTNEKFFRVGKTAPYFSWETTKHKYFYIDSTVTPHDTLWWEGVKLSKDYTWTGKHTFKNVTTFDSTMYLANNQFFSSKVFVPGWGGSGWKLDYGLTNAARSSLEFDDLTVRGRLSVYELLIRQIRATNGAVFVTASAKVASVSGTTVTFEDASYTGGTYLCPFAAGDLLMVQKFRPDGTTVIKLAKATVSSVSSASAVVVWDVGTFAKGDEVVRIGNTTDASRQNSIYLTSDDSNSPFMDMTTGVNSWTAWDAAAKTKLRIGNLAGITDSDFGGALSGNGLYGQNVYLKGKLKIASNADIIGLSANVTITSTTAPTTRTNGTALVVGDVWIESDNNNKNYVWNGSSWVDASDWSPLPVYTNGATFPATPKTGDWHFFTGAEGAYHTNTWYRYSGAAWENKGLTGTYVDGTGIYTGTVVANNIIAGTGIVNALSILSTLTMGSASTDGYIQSYGWNGTANGYQIKGGATPSVNLVGGIITGGKIQTAINGNRIILNGSTNQINLYHASGAAGSIYVTNDPISIQINASNYGNVQITGIGINLIGGASAYSMDIGSSGVYFSINSSGQITKINNTVTAKYVPISNGTHYEPRYLTMSDLPALTANKVLLSDASGYVSVSGVTNTTLGYLDATSSIQTQINSKQATITGAATTITTSDLTASKALVSGATGKVEASTVTATTLSYLDATSSVQTQLNSKASLTADNTLTGENSFAKLKFNAEVSHSVTGSGNYDCLNKNVIILTPNASGYTVGLTNLSPNRPVLVLNASGSYTITVNSTSGGKLLPVYGMAWMVYNATSATTFIQ